MKFKLPCGKVAELFISHTDDELAGSPESMHPNPGFRGTRVTFKLDGREYEARSICKPPDQFCRLEGRKRAANRLLGLLRDKQRFPTLELDKLDRAAIFAGICPEYDLGWRDWIHNAIMEAKAG